MLAISCSSIHLQWRVYVRHATVDTVVAKGSHGLGCCSRSRIAASLDPSTFAPEVTSDSAVVDGSEISFVLQDLQPGQQNQIYNNNSQYINRCYIAVLFAYNYGH